MKHVEEIQLINFRGVRNLTVSLEDLTLLAGLNNSGKTSVLQALFVLAEACGAIQKQQDNTGSINISEMSTRFGMPGWRKGTFTNAIKRSYKSAPQRALARLAP